ncbi:MAG: acetolactate decarboxylase [Verrucomicrobia bacterium]|jgi:acetolactate decarboxylase|nr:acetolactate decarboxylase [Verrucomicrobiota bacterium]
MKKTYLTFKQIIPTLAAFMTSAVIVAQDVAIHRSIEIELTTQSGIYYQLESSEDFQIWKPVGNPFLGRGHVQSQFLRIENQHIFYRVKPTDATPSAEEDAVFQYSTLGALLVGVYEGDLTFGELMMHGNHGLGTFQGVDGELIITDGKAYKVRVDGNAYEVAMDEKTPFAVTTFFEPDLVIDLEHVTSFQDFQNQVDAVIPSQNQIYSMRIKGAFNTLTTRSVPVQNRPYPSLTEVVAAQTEFQFSNISGTMVGFLLPGYVANINASGHHLHFIDSDRTTGGHVLDFSADNIRVELDICSRLSVDIPENSDFQEANLE